MSHRDRRRKHAAAAVGPEPWLRHLSPELHNNPKSVAWAKSKDELDEEMRNFHRRLVDHYGFHNGCPLSRCRRAHRCVDAKVQCYEWGRPWLKKNAFPTLMPLLRAKAAAGAADKPPESSL
jgi:hypothetical protein